MKWWPKEATAGDIVRVKVGAIYHFGIFVSEDEVIQFGGSPINGFTSDQSRVKVISTDIDHFANDTIIEVGELERSEKKKAYTPEEVVRRAREHMGETGYDVLNNNCEHFANWCLLGEKFSTQTDGLDDRFREIFLNGKIN